MDFDMMADKHPILIDLMGICAGMTHASREGRQVDYHEGEPPGGLARCEGARDSEGV